MLKVNISVVLLVVFCYGTRHVLSRNVFVRHHGHNKDNCGNLTLPCRSVRYAVKISKADDVIYIDYAEGRPYKECEHPKENYTIMLDKSLSFYGFNGTAILHCQQIYAFFGINNSEHTTPKIVFSNLSLASRGDLVYAKYNISSKFELEFNFCDIERSLYFVRAKSLSCSIQVFNSTIRSYRDPILADCTNLTARLNGSTFFSCQIKLSTGTISSNYYDSNPESNVHIYNCTFNTTKKPLVCNSLVTIILETAICNVTIKSSVFVNFYDVAMPKSAALLISLLTRRVKTSVVLDRLHFENINCDSAVIYMHLLIGIGAKLFNVGIFNSMFVNTTRVFQCYIDRYSVMPFFNDSVKLYNNTFNNTSNILRKEGLIYLVSGRYHLSSCRFFHNVPAFNPDFPLIRVESSVTVTFEFFSYKSYPITENSRNGNLLNSNMYYIISYESHTEALVMKGYFTIFCPPGYRVNLNKQCRPQSRNLADSCNLFLASCEQCPANTYSLNRGAVHNSRSNNIACKNCPAGGNCLGGQVTSKKNFWGYESNQTVKFQQCPPKYCCNTDHCEHYDGCYGNRNGTLCGECPIGMSESLFNTKCKPNKHCTSVVFWPGVSAYLILYLVFFLYQEDIFNFVQSRVISRTFLPSRNGRNAKPGGLIKIIFYYYQVVHLLRNSIGSDEKDQLLDDMENFLSRAFNFLIIDIFSLDCPFQDLRPVQKTIIVHSVGYCLLVLLCLLYFSTLVFKILQKLRTRFSHQTVSTTETIELPDSPNPVENPFEDRIFGAFAYISLLMYNSTTQLCLSLLYCVPVDNTQVLFLDGNIKCYQTFQNYLFGYMISSILPFCLVPVLGSYLLKLNRISVAQFCLACIFPLPFCCYWSYLLVRNSSWCTRHLCRVETNGYGAAIIEDDSSTFEDREIVSGEEAEPRSSNSAVLRVLLGPFRQHKATFIFPSSHLPWEGFLIFRRLALILVLTFVSDYQMKATLSTMLCVAILLTHVFVKPFKTTCDNVLETLSLGNLIIISLFALVKSVYYGEDLDLSSLKDMINVVENILIISPVILIIVLVIVCILCKLVMMFRFCFQALFRR